jgi:hypothetical protein
MNLLDHITKSQRKTERHLINFTDGNAFSFVGSLRDLKHVLDAHQWTQAASFKCVEL